MEETIKKIIKKALCCIKDFERFREDKDRIFCADNRELEILCFWEVLDITYRNNTTEKFFNLQVEQDDFGKLCLDERIEFIKGFMRIAEIITNKE